MNLPIEQAIEELKNMPGFAFSQVLTIAKVKTKDGRDAVIRVEITTDEDAVEDADAAIWTPNTEAQRAAEGGPTGAQS